MLPQEKQLSDFSPLYHDFADFLAGQSFIALLNARHPSLISLSGTKVKKRNELALVRFSPNLVLFSPNTIFADEMGDFWGIKDYVSS